MGTAYQIKNPSACYFLTFQVVGWADVFSRRIYRDIIIDSLEYCRKNKGLELFAYIIMTNHIHVVVRSKHENLPEVIHDFKRFTSKKILNEIATNLQESRKEWLEMIFQYHGKFNKRVSGKQFWTHENHAVELNTNEMIDSKINYIHENPVEAGWVINAEDYLYSSARNYAGLESIIEIDKI